LEPANQNKEKQKKTKFSASGSTARTRSTSDRTSFANARSKNLTSAWKEKAGEFLSVI
jgi:hypothetical protein